MVKIENNIFIYYLFSFIKIDQFMLGHGFNSEIAQNKTMATSFDNNLSNDNFKSQQISSNQLTSSDNSLGKKVIITNLKSNFVEHDRKGVWKHRSRNWDLNRHLQCIAVPSYRPRHTSHETEMYRVGNNILIGRNRYRSK
jgi:hypothetical protein